MKMNNSTADLNYELYEGLRFKGKWNKRSYTLIRKLGAGVTGTVYLAKGDTGLVAIKVGQDQMSIAQEVNVLKQFSKVQEKVLGPCLFDVDDFESNYHTLPFYVMEYIQGKDFVLFMKDRGSEWLHVLTLQLLQCLHELHEQGWVFGDLKPDNVIITNREASVRLLDVGGTTRVGRAIKEYTEYYDRGFWSLGSRKAEPSYDLFSVAMIMIDCAYPNQFKKEKGNTLAQLKRKVNQAPLLKPYQEVLMKALQGGFDTAAQMKQALMTSGDVNVAESNLSRKQYRIDKKRKKKQSKLFDLLLVSSFVLLLFVLYLLIRMF
ncbi:protein kinase [Bacillus sp. JCM 19041]|uniref:serine/threonine protein kinase n=1 Tax=Bacillus sp. JCM 19041 TaxID=1460637 RepID=UPI0006D00DF5